MSDPAPPTDVIASAVLRPVSGGNPFEETVGRIVQAIKLGVVVRGDRLPSERDLALRLEVSRVTLRSAIRALQQAGYIESKRGRTGGSFVIWQPDHDNSGDPRAIARKLGARLVDVLRFRTALEPGAAYLAADNDLSPAQRATIITASEAMHDAPCSDYRGKDVRFHLAVADAAGSPALSAAIADVQMTLSDLLAAIPLLPAALEHSRVQHDAIVRAILTGDADAARAAMTEHVAATATLVEGFLG